jgi:hypothetical protein
MTSRSIHTPQPEYAQTEESIRSLKKAAPLPDLRFQKDRKISLLFPECVPDELHIKIIEDNALNGLKIAVQQALFCDPPSGGGYPGPIHVELIKWIAGALPAPAINTMPVLIPRQAI